MKRGGLEPRGDEGDKGGTVNRGRADMFKGGVGR